jgi:hypothetical protein
VDKGRKVTDWPAYLKSLVPAVIAGAAAFVLASIIFGAFV